MALFRQHNTPTYRWSIWKYEETIEQLMQLLPAPSAELDTYLQGIDRFTSESRLREWLTVRVLLYRMLGKLELIRYDAQERPYFDDPHLHVSISHTKGYAAILISTAHEVGIDIEHTSPRVQRIANRFLGTQELAAIHALPAEDRQIEVMLLCWSAKESVYKCLGQSGIDFRRQLNCQLPVENPTALLCSVAIQTPITLQVNYIIHKDFVMTWVNN